MIKDNLIRIKSILFKLLPCKLKIKLTVFKNRFFKIPRDLKPSNKKVKKTIIILGVGRSGTSMLSEIIQDFGVNIGWDLIEANEFNKRGHFENKLFVQMNDKLLALTEGTWDFPPIEEEIFKLINNIKLMEEIKRLVRSQEDELWGWKDPRTILTISLYLPFLVNPFFIVIHRNKDAVAKSLNRTGFQIERGLKLCDEYKRRLRDFLSKNKYPVLELNYEDFFKNPKKQINKIKNFLGIKKDINHSIIDKRLKHF